MVNINLRPYVGLDILYDIEILACEISKHRHEKIVLDLREDARCLVTSGIERAVQNICDTLDIPYEQIEFRSCDRKTNGTVFKHTLNEDLLWFFPYHTYPNAQIDIPNEFKYGMFLGRPCNERLYSFHKHWTWPYKNRGIASQSLKLDIQDESASEFTNFICEHHSKWEEIRPILPYTDLDDGGVYNRLRKGSGHAIPVTGWQGIYKNLAVEIVLETVHTSGMFFTTEKVFRPMNHGKLFLVVGSPEFEKNLQALGFDIFEDIIDKSYDSLSGYMRVDAVFNSLARLLDNPVDLKQLLPRLERNRLLVEQMKQHDSKLEAEYTNE